ncbi:LuxR C-terminal-related transcriptional regulator [Streptomyces cinerochromogenes]|uniref:LuxR C-terminal-related transcriptional regulator n=1 Tax=Streptomyces cinerochromogenes TaxID=66422 RepID=UPI0036C38F2B
MTTALSRPAILTPQQHRVAAQLVHGLPHQLIARQADLSGPGVASHLTSARRRMGCPNSSRAVLVHALLTAREVPPPASTGPAPDFTDHERAVIRAIAEHTRNDSIGAAIGVRASDVRTEIDAVVTKAGARSAAHLVGLAHTWGILGGTATPRHQEPAASVAGPA